MNLILFTHDFPFGSGEPFLFDELDIATNYFDIILVISTSRNCELKRKLPPHSNIKYVKLDKSKYCLNSIIYVVKKIFSHELINEIKTSHKQRSKHSYQNIIRSCIIYWLTQRRCDIYLSKLNIDWENTILYSYWLSTGAFTIAKFNHKVFSKISRVHSYEIRDHQSYVPFRIQLDSELNKMFFISEYTQNEYNNIMNYLNKKQINNKLFISRLGIKTQFSFPKFKFNNVFNILSCSQIYELKRLDIIIDIIEKIQTNYTIRWTHIGWGPLGSEIKKYAEKKLRNLSNTEYNFLGEMDNSEILNYYKTNYIDLFINTSDFEGIPVSIMEAMSFGIPCMARNVGGNSEIIISKYNGILLEATEDIYKYSNELDIFIQYKLQNKSYIDRSNCISFIDKKFNMKKNYVEFYNNITNI